MHGLAYPRFKRNYWKHTDNALKVAIEVFTPQMYIICMGTGVVGVLLRNNPYQFRGLHTISVILWIIDLVFFLFVSVVFFTRWIMFPLRTRAMFETDIEQTTYLSTIVIAAATILELLALIPGANWKNWEWVAFGLWWFVVGMALVGSTTVYWILIREEEVHLSNLSPTLAYPTTGVLATAAAGAVVVRYTPLEIGVAMPVVVVSYLLLGMGFFLTILTVTAYFTRLLAHQTPEPKKIAAQFIPVAALGNASYAFNLLGYVSGPSKRIFELYGRGTVASEMIGNAIYASGLIWGLVIWGFATYWMIIGVVTFVSDIRKTKFSLYMWSASYPIGIYGVACSQFATDFDSPAFRVVTCIITVLSFAYWCFCIIWTLPLAISGELFLGHAKEAIEEETEAAKRIQSRRSGDMESQVERRGSMSDGGQPISTVSSRHRPINTSSRTSRRGSEAQA